MFLFKLGSSVENYRLFFGKSNGTAGDALLSLDPDTNSANGMEFSTFDRDNDFMPELNCATLYTGGWWFRRCTTSNLNGIFYPDCSGVDQSDSLQWVEDPQMTPQSFKLVEMKFRPTIYPPMD